MGIGRRLSERRLFAPLALCAVAVVISFWQRPHSRFSDQRIELITDPGRLFSQVANLWTSTIDLGHIQASQFVGYLFPMGPFFALGDALGLPVWLVQRFWIAGILAIGAWGVVRLLERLLPARTQSAAFIAGLIYITGPFITIGLNRGTSWLLAAALLPWMLLWTQRGIARGGDWVAAAAVALLMAAAGGGLNAAVVFWLLAAIVLLGLFEAATGPGLRAVLAFGWRAALLGAITSLWWIVPVIAQALYGANYLTFTEHAAAIFHTPSASESLRLLGYWVGYISGYPDPAPQLPAIAGYLLSAPTILATFAVPAIAVASILLLRRWRYATFFALLLSLAVLTMSLGFPQSSGWGGTITDLYYSAGPLQFLRTTYKAAPLAALALACLAGAGLGGLFDQLKGLKLQLNGARRAVWPLTAVFIVLLGALVLFWGRPLWAGNAIDPRLFFASVPTPWVQAIADAQRTTPADTRIAVVPGDLFGWYTWGGTQNSVVPGLSAKPVLVRQIARPATEPAAQLLDSVDERIQQGRLTPGQLPPLLQLMGVGRVLVAADSSPQRGEALDPARAAAVLAEQPGFEKAAASFGPVASFSPPPDRGGVAVKLPQVRAYAAPKPAYPRISRVHSAQAPAVVDGDAEGLIAMAAVGALDPTKASFYAADLNKGSLRALLAERPTLTFTDSNRRRGVLVAKLTTNTGPTLGATDPLSREFPDYNPFAALGDAGRTVAVYSGLTALFSPVIPGFTLFPEHRPYAALDGDLTTSWVTQERDSSKRYIELTLDRPRPVRAIRVRPHNDAVTLTRRLQLSVNGGAERMVALHSGWNRIVLDSAKLRTLRLRLPGRTSYFGVTASGLDEVQIPGLRVTEALRLPTRLSTLASGMQLSASAFDIVTERVTADFPRRSGKATGSALSFDPLDMVDAEQGMRRLVELPAARAFRPSGWASVSPQADDAAIDQLAGMSSANRFTSSARFEGLPINRASSAFDHDKRTAWVAEYSFVNNPWIRWRGSAPISLRRLWLQPRPGRYLRVTRATVATPAGGFDLRVRKDGLIRLPTTLVTRSLKITIRATARLPRTRRGARVPRSVALSEIVVPGLPVAAPRRHGRFASGCDAASVSGPSGRVGLHVSGDLGSLDAGAALPAASCSGSPPLRLREGANLVVQRPGSIFAIDALRLHSRAPQAAPSSRPPAARISPAGKVTLNGSGWLVLGQSYSPGWQAWCTDGAGNERKLGAPKQIDGFANGWRIDGRSCAAARFAFGPQRYATIAYWLSALAAALIVVMLLVAARRRRGRRAQAPVPQASSTEVTLNTRKGFSLIVGSQSLPNDQRLPDDRPRSRSATALYRLAVAAIIAVAVLYVINPNSDARGINFDYPLDHMAEHWLAALAMAAVVVAAVVDSVGWSRARRDES